MESSKGFFSFRSPGPFLGWETGGIEGLDSHEGLDVSKRQNPGGLEPEGVPSSTTFNGASGWRLFCSVFFCGVKLL